MLKLPVNVALRTPFYRGKIFKIFPRCITSSSKPEDKNVFSGANLPDKSSKRGEFKKQVHSQAEDIQQETNKKNWITWGFNISSEEEDNTNMHMIFFVYVTLALTLTAYMWIYAPDKRLKHWARREAYLELRRRENEGLPLIDGNFINPDKFTLPSHEELGDTEIII